MGTENQMSMESDSLPIIPSCLLAVATLAFFLSKLGCIFEEGMMLFVLVAKTEGLW